jgi:hypothetical protein
MRTRPMEFNTTKRDSPQGNRDFAPIGSLAMDVLAVPQAELPARGKTKGSLVSRPICTLCMELEAEITSDRRPENQTQAVSTAVV